ncbi:MAG: hypothetical protein M3355_08880 [Actinomycetota bacterium]|nr:hypothetical protein [Actinomycetota bacterium]
MRRGTLIAALALLLAGCGGDDAGTPVACLADAEAYIAALGSAPGEVRLEGTTAISECLVENQSEGDLGSVGEQLIDAATQLNSEALKDPGGEAAVSLGYLIGAVQEGASETGGIHSDLVIRLDAAARFSEGGGPLPVDFERAFGEGYAAGQATG